jgi:hypothetical protein
MYCPKCASNQSDDIKFCTVCGANLQAVRLAIEGPQQAEAKFDWSNTWVAEMFMSGQAHELRRREMERRLGITPEVKRYQEIKAGVIVSSIGVALMIFLFVFMQGIIGKVAPETVPIITRLWVAGVIPVFVGLALMLNGMVVSKKMVEIQKQNMSDPRSLPATESNPKSLKSADTNEFVHSGLSVTEGTTRHLNETVKR